jgi:hypothetical protein
MNIKASGNILETGAEIHLNGPGAGSAADAETASTVTPVLPNDALISVMSQKAWIPDTMELLSIDLPNPRPAVGTSISQLALNTMNQAEGVGGENIRNLHDGIADMEKGLSAYVTKTYPATKDTKVYTENQSEAYWTGEHQKVVQEPWNGQTSEPQKQVPLGPFEPERLVPVAPPC